MSFRGRPAKTLEGRQLENYAKNYAEILAHAQFHFYKILKGIEYTDLSIRFEPKLIQYERIFQSPNMSLTPSSSSSDFKYIVSDYIFSFSKEYQKQSEYGFQEFTDRPLIDVKKKMIDNNTAFISINTFIDIYLFIISIMSKPSTFSIFCRLFYSIFDKIKQDFKLNSTENKKIIEFEKYFNLKDCSLIEQCINNSNSTNLEQSLIKQEEGINNDYFILEILEGYRKIYLLMQQGLEFFNTNPKKLLLVYEQIHGSQ